MSRGDFAIIEHTNVWVMLTRIMQTESCASVPSTLLQALKAKSMLQYLLHVYSLMSQSQLSLAMHCVCVAYT